MKNSLLPIAIVLIILSVFLIFNSTQAVKNIRQTLDVERYQRMTAEEKLQQAETRIRILQSQVSQIQTILQDQEVPVAPAETISQQEVQGPEQVLPEPTANR